MKTNLFKTISLISAVILLLAAPACSYTGNAQLVSAGYTRQEQSKGYVSDAFTKAALSFGFELLRDMTKESNALVSPVSALYCLALAANGAGGNTLAQIENALGCDLATLNEGAYAFAQTLSNEQKCKVALANSIWFNNDENKLHVKPEFLQKNADWYDAQIYSSEFDADTAKDINNWVSDNTDGLIKNIVDEIDPYTVMYLINTLFFDAEWSNMYEDNEIRDSEFINADGSKSKVEMMYSDEGCYYEYGGAIGVSKSYTGNKYSFVAMLPQKGTDIYEFVHGIDAEYWQGFISSKKYVSVNSGIPQFKFESDIMDFVPTAKRLGMSDMLDERIADLSEIGSSPVGNLYVKEYKQKTVIEVNQRGTRAGAVTSIGIAKESMPSEVYEVYLDRPFVYAIVDNETGIPLFAGVMADMN